MEFVEDVVNKTKFAEGIQLIERYKAKAMAEWQEVLLKDLVAQYHKILYTVPREEYNTIKFAATDAGMISHRKDGMKLEVKDQRLEFTLYSYSTPTKLLIIFEPQDLAEHRKFKELFDFW